MSAVALPLRIRYWTALSAGIVLLLLGGTVLFFGLPDFGKAPKGLNYEKLSELKAGDAGFPIIESHFPADKIERFALRRQDQTLLTLYAARYKDDQDRPQSALIYLPDDKKDLPGQHPPLDRQRLRHDLWQKAAGAIEEHAGKDALLVSWWDNAQRLHFLTGAHVWLKAPVAEAFTDPGQEDFWRKISGGFAPDNTALSRLARWLTMDAEEALVEMADALPKGQKVYFVICLDDLARLSEIENLSGASMPFEMRLFPAADNIHTLIGQVKSWAQEKGNGSYLVQQLPGHGARAWRILEPSAQNTLLARLLPFTHSLARPLEGMKLVYQSTWGGYLSVFQWQP